LVFAEQSSGVLTQSPPAQTSVVHALLSLQPALTPFEFACWQPSVVLHESVVQTLSSSQGLPGFATSISVCVQPVPLSQASTVQALVSEQSTAAPATQSPAKHVGAFVHLSVDGHFGSANPSSCGP
jgi:hypothetical protein